jgi:hypothetical protein
MPTTERLVTWADTRPPTGISAVRRTGAQTSAHLEIALSVDMPVLGYTWNRVAERPGTTISAARNRFAGRRSTPAPASARSLRLTNPHEHDAVATQRPQRRAPVHRPERVHQEWRHTFIRRGGQQAVAISPSTAPTALLRHWTSGRPTRPCAHWHMGGWWSNRRYCRRPPNHQRRGRASEGDGSLSDPLHRSAVPQDPHRQPALRQ